MSLGPGSIVTVHLQQPPEKYWGVLERLEPVGELESYRQRFERRTGLGAATVFGRIELVDGEPG